MKKSVSHFVTIAAIALSTGLTLKAVPTDCLANRAAVSRGVAGMTPVSSRADEVDVHEALQRFYALTEGLARVPDQPDDEAWKRHEAALHVRARALREAMKPITIADSTGVDFTWFNASDAVNEYRQSLELARAQLNQHIHRLLDHGSIVPQIAKLAELAYGTGALPSVHRGMYRKAKIKVRDRTTRTPQVEVAPGEQVVLVMHRAWSYGITTSSHAWHRTVYLALPGRVEEGAEYTVTSDEGNLVFFGFSGYDMDLIPPDRRATARVRIIETERNTILAEVTVEGVIQTNLGADAGREPRLEPVRHQGVFRFETKSPWKNTPPGA